MSDQKDNLLTLLCDLGDLSALVSDSDTIEQFLQKTVHLVARYLNTPVCTIYLYDDTAGMLVMKATVGLNPQSVEQVRMRLDEGLVGTVMASRQPVREGCASKNPRFKHFPGTDELRYESFLAVPLHKGEVNIGVLVVQHTALDYFSATDTIALRAAGAQLTAALENARLLMDLQRLESAADQPVHLPPFIKGRKSASGYAYAPGTVWKKSHGGLLAGNDGAGYGTLADFQRAIDRTVRQLETLQHRCAASLPESAALIFSAHFMIMKDRKFTSRMEAFIRDGWPASRAIRAVAGHYVNLFHNSPHPYIREKVCDIEDLAGRMLQNLTVEEASIPDGPTGSVVVARDLYPSEMLKLSAQQTAGVVLVGGGVTSHVAILARALNLPMVIVDCPDMLALPEHTPLLVDGDTGNVYIDPDDAIIQKFEARNTLRRQMKRSAAAPQCGRPETADGVKVDLMANINLLSELPLAKAIGAHGIGLYRTEFPFLIRPSFPSETEQFLVYKQVVDAMQARPVTFRTLDIGGEKALAYTDTAEEPNPELGMRAIRFTMAFPDIFEQQLRAILRAAANGADLRIMFPLIASLDDFRQARALVRSCIEQLAAEGVAHHPAPSTGMMVELPAVVNTIDAFAAEADFFAIGTNDLTQYMLGVDRSNTHVAQYYRPEHPSVLRAVDRVVAAAAEASKPVCICGEMAHDARLIPFLVGIGLRRFSIDPQFIPHVSQTISRLHTHACQTQSEALLAADTLADVKALLPEAEN